MGDRGTRHTRILEATKEIFVPVTYGSGSSWQGIGGHHGYLLEGDADYAFVELYMPWDFKSLREASVSFIALATLTPMTFRVVTDYCKAGVGYFDHNQLVNVGVNTTLNRLQEAGIPHALRALASNAPLEAGEYLGVQISRQAGQNTNAIFLGVRIRYNTPLYAHAP